MHVYMYVCVCVCMCVCACAWVRVCVHVLVYACVSVRGFICGYASLDPLLQGIVGHIYTSVHIGTPNNFFRIISGCSVTIRIICTYIAVRRHVKR